MARVFISYSHQDEAWKERIVSHLKVLAGDGLEAWDDRRIAAGDDWQPEIEQAIAQCDVALLLISRHFLTSRFILGNEVPSLLQRRQEQGVRVIPVILSPCQWTGVGWLKHIQARPKDGKALSGMTEHKADEALSLLTGEIHQRSQRLSLDHPPGATVPPEAIDLTHLPEGAPHFLGREQELQQLDDAWANPGRTAIVTIIAAGGVGKTALTKRWLDGLRAQHWLGARRVYGWSFYSQGTSDDRQASEDHFLAETLKAFRVDIAPNAAAADRGRALGEAIVQSRTLLILDGVEPLQYPPGPLEGRLRAPGLEALLVHLATAGQPGLCLLSSRERLTDLAEYERSDQHAHGPVLRLDLGNLSDRDGARLLFQQGANRAGAAALTEEDEELQQASREVSGHALTLSLLGGYLALAFEGDIRRRHEIHYEEADRETKNGHAFKVMRAYEIWLEQNQAPRELAALRLLAFYDRPASPESLAALRAAPAIAGLTEALQDLTDAQWRTTLKRLQGLGLALLPSPSGGGAGGEGAFAAATTPLDAHPLIREYLAHRLQHTQPEAWREGHRRLYDFLKTSVEDKPDSLAGLQPLYQAVAHGCKAGLWQAACVEVYRDRILRGDEFYSIRNLGAIGADLGAVACFFPQPWRQPAPVLSEAHQAWLLNAAAFSLRALGRLGEALEPMRVSGEMDEQREDWKNAAASYSNLSQLQLTLGRVTAAVVDARTAVAHADRGGDVFLRMVNRTTLADALHQQQGEVAALPLFVEAEAFQQEDQPEYPLLYSLRGFQYCDALLAGAERAAWGEMLGRSRLAGDAGGGGEKSFAGKPAPTGASGDDGQAGAGETAAAEGGMLGFVPQPKLQDCAAVAERAGQTLQWAEMNKASLLGIALDHLTLARAALYAALLQAAAPTPAQAHAEQAVAGLRAAGVHDMLARGLLTRAWLAHCLGDDTAARADLAEVERIARRGNMRLHLADLHLTRARLFHDPDALAQARRLFEECGYNRRLPELEDAEARLPS